MGEKLTLFVGTYTRLGSLGIYTCRMDAKTGALEQVAVMGGVENPSFLAVDPAGDHLYAVAETANSKGEGAVHAYSIDGDGSLTFLNQRSTGGADPCHLAVDATDSYVIVANYVGGSVGMLPIRPAGHLGERCHFIQHEGSSVNVRRQGEAHAHSVTIDPTNSWAYVCDLGMDRIVVYRIDREGGCLEADDALTVRAEPGQGPRHFDFHPSGEYCYVLNEIGSTVAVYDHDGRSGRLSGKQLISTLPEGWEGVNGTADIHVSLDGRFLYASNRGHDSIAMFAIDPRTGELASIDHEPTRGKNPRNFALSPDGRFLLAENSNSASILTFAIDAETGQLEFTGNEIEIPGPVCIKFKP
ncbi:MAG: lactonase family protein [Dehalococcoidia bacterium]|jgi:6-phosphogluconolactonase|nr:lactonase family protein [Dehalococcoidia bacterium]